MLFLGIRLWETNEYPSQKCFPFSDWFLSNDLKSIAIQNWYKTNQSKGNERSYITYEGCLFRWPWLITEFGSATRTLVDRTENTSLLQKLLFVYRCIFKKRPRSRFLNPTRDSKLMLHVTGLAPVPNVVWTSRVFIFFDLQYEKHENSLFTSHTTRVAERGEWYHRHAWSAVASQFLNINQYNKFSFLVKRIFIGSHIRYFGNQLLTSSVWKLKLKLYDFRRNVSLELIEGSSSTARNVAVECSKRSNSYWYWKMKLYFKV